jgi:hypothetical protein
MRALCFVLSACGKNTIKDTTSKLQAGINNNNHHTSQSTLDILHSYPQSKQKKSYGPDKTLQTKKIQLAQH